MRRKTILLAGKTIVVSLPNTWVKAWGIKKGEELELTENGPNITIRTTKEKATKAVEIDITGEKERVVRWTLSGLHKKGYDEIDITLEKEQLPIIQELLNDLFTGFVIVNQAPQRIKIQSISKDDKESYEQVLRRAFLVTLELAEKTAEYYKKGGDKEELLRIEKTNNKLTNFCQRVLNKYGHEEPQKTTFMYVILWNLEKIADDYKYLINDTDKAEKSTIELLDKTNMLLRAYYEIFYKFEPQRMNELAEQSTQLKREIYKNKELIASNHLASIVQKIRDFSASTTAINCKS